MRLLPLLFGGLAVCSLACSNTDDGSVTDDSNELIEGASALERDLAPPIAAPKVDLIGKKIHDVVGEVTKDLKAYAPKANKDGCTVQKFEIEATKKVRVERQVCKTSDVVRVLTADGKIETEYGDLDKDGAVDRFTGQDKSAVQYLDANFDGKVDTIIESVDLIDDFSLDGYDDAEYPKSKFLYRVRIDKNRDGKLDLEKLIARGQLTPS